MDIRTTILLVDDDDTFRSVLARELARSGATVLTARTAAEGLKAARDAGPRIVLLDLRLPDRDGMEVLEALKTDCPGADVIMLTGHGNIDTAIRAVRLGAFDFVAKPCPLEELEIRIQRALERQSLRDRASLLERGLTPAAQGSTFLGESPTFRKIDEVIRRVAPSDSTVLLSGETGTGKEMAAKRIHSHSPRRNRPFVIVECAALQEDLLQNELFGHERGAFTGADRAKPGLFEVADGGTIFLDEIGEVSPATQVKLLRVLDTSTFRHVGGTAEIRVDVRVLAATNRDLAALVRQGLFREDLYYRMSTIRIDLPPLRERPQDVDVLADHYVALFNARFGVDRRLGPEARDALRRHSWPGNVRELLHVVEAAMVVCAGPVLLPEHLPATVLRASGATEPSDADPESLPTLEALERAHIERVLKATGGHRSRAARILGISERNLYRKLR